MNQQMFRQMKRVRKEYLEQQERERVLSLLVSKHPSVMEQLSNEMEDVQVSNNYEESKDQELICVGKSQVQIPRVDLKRVARTDDKDDSELALLQTPIDFRAVRRQLALQL